jgi:hypothetical protein
VRTLSLLVVLLSALAVAVSHTASSAPTVYPTGLTVNRPHKTYKGYTVYVSITERRIVVLDMGGKEVHSWRHPQGHPVGEVIKPLPNGHILTHFRADPNSPDERTLTEMDWNGNVVWQFSDPRYPFLHHDYERMENGNTLILGARFQDCPNVADREIKNDFIIEVDPNGQVVWEWLICDHYEELQLTEDARRIIYDGRILPKNDEKDVFHANSLQALPSNRLFSELDDTRFRPGNVLVSLRNLNLIFIVDKPTGRVVWQLSGGSDADDGVRIDPLAPGFIGQHHVRMIPQGLRGAGNILMFDNGGHAGYPRSVAHFSRVVEMDPLTGAITWQYDALKAGRPLLSFFSPYRSSAQRLPNGNTLITESEWGRIFEVNQDHKTVWEYINPYYKSGGSYQNRLYRAYRVDYTWRERDFPKFVW